jgi:hypothetical protein
LGGVPSSACGRSGPFGSVLKPDRTMQSAVESGRPPPACRGGRSKEIEAASRVRQECARPSGTRRFIRGASRGCKVRGLTGNHRRPSRLSRIRGNPKTQRRQRQGKETRGNPNLQPRAQSRGCVIRGNSNIHPRAQRKDAPVRKPSNGQPESRRPKRQPSTHGATRGCQAGTDGGCGTGGDTDPKSPGWTGRSMIQ